MLGFLTAGVHTLKASGASFSEAKRREEGLGVIFSTAFSKALATRSQVIQNSYIRICLERFPVIALMQQACWLASSLQPANLPTSANCLVHRLYSSCNLCLVNWGAISPMLFVFLGECLAPNFPCVTCNIWFLKTGTSHSFNNNHARWSAKVVSLCNINCTKLLFTSVYQHVFCVLQSLFACDMVKSVWQIVVVQTAADLSKKISVANVSLCSHLENFCPIVPCSAE